MMVRIRSLIIICLVLAAVAPLCLSRGALADGLSAWWQPAYNAYPDYPWEGYQPVLPGQTVAGNVMGEILYSFPCSIPWNPAAPYSVLETEPDGSQIGLSYPAPPFGFYPGYPFPSDPKDSNMICGGVNVGRHNTAYQIGLSWTYYTWDDQNNEVPHPASGFLNFKDEDIVVNDPNFPYHDIFPVYGVSSAHTIGCRITDAQSGTLEVLEYDVWALDGGASGPVFTKQFLNTVSRPGSHSWVWDGRDANGNRVSDGLYTYSVRSGGDATSDPTYSWEMSVGSITPVQFLGYNSELGTYDFLSSYAISSYGAESEASEGYVLVYDSWHNKVCTLNMMDTTCCECTGQDTTGDPLGMLQSLRGPRYAAIHTVKLHVPSGSVQRGEKISLVYSIRDACGDERELDGKPNASPNWLNSVYRDFVNRYAIEYALPALVGDVIYVAPYGSDGNDGSSWEKAVKDVDYACSMANAAEVWVTPWNADGSLGATSCRRQPYSVGGNVGIYGGFCGEYGGAYVPGGHEERDGQDLPPYRGRVPQYWQVCPTTLPGGIFAGNSDPSDGLGQGVTIDGFTISGGSGGYTEDQTWYGGGVCALNTPLTITHDTISGCSADCGGAIYCDIDPTLPSTESRIIGNYIEGCYGGGIVLSNCGGSEINNNVIGNNNLWGSSGGGLFAEDCPNLAVVNDTFAENSVSGSQCTGGGIALDPLSNANIENCIFYNNSASSAWSISGSGAVSHCLFYSTASGGTEVSNHLSGCSTDGTLIFADPILATVNGLPYHLRDVCSPCVDAGAQAGADYGDLTPAEDIDGNPRAVKILNSSVSQLVIDIGAHELQNAVETPQFSPLPGVFYTPQTVTISCQTPGSVIYFTTDGSDPTANSPQYQGPISVTQHETIKAIACTQDLGSSLEAIGEYKLTVSTPVISPKWATQFDQVSISCCDTAATIYYTVAKDNTAGSGDPTTSSLVYTTPIQTSAYMQAVGDTLTIEAKAFKNNWLPSATAVGQYVCWSLPQVGSTYVLGPPSNTPPSGILPAVIIHASLQGWTPDLTDYPQLFSQVPISIHMRLEGSGNQTVIYNTHLDSNGNCVLTNVPPGTYDMSFEPWHWLCSAVYGVPVNSGCLELVETYLLNGDVNGDNAVDDQDYSLMGAAWYSVVGDSNYNVNADLNGDGAVEDQDYSIMGLNWYATGDSPI